MPRIVFALLASLGIADRAGCQTTEAPTPPRELKNLSLEELTDVQVTSVSRHPEKLSKTPSAIQVITSEDIRRSGATTIPEALRLADNLDVAQVNSHDWAITARGFNTSLANKLLVLIDGRTVYTPLFSGVFWDRQNYLLADIDRIEVISGPGGSLWGANAVNGVINIITKNAKDTQGGYLEAGGGNQLQGAAGVRYGGALGTDVYGRVYGQYFDRGNEIHSDGSAVTDAWHQGQGGFRLDAVVSGRDSLTAQGDFYSGEEDALSGGVSSVSGRNLLGRWSHVASSESVLSLQVYYDHTHLAEPVPALVINSTEFAPAGTLSDDLDTYDVDFQHRFSLGEANHIEWGIGYRRTHDVVGNAPALAFLPSVLDQNLYSGFVQDEIALRPELTLSVGTKLEHNDYTGFEVEPSMRLQWNVADNHMLWAAISRAVRTPSRVDRDLFEPAPPSALTILEGSSAFVSETVIARELGYRALFAPNIVFSIAAFYNDYTNVRSTGFTPNTILPFIFQNNLEGETHGMEFSVDYRAADWWRLHAGFDPLKENIHVKPNATDINAGHNETADPEQRASLRSSMDLTDRVELDAALRWVDARQLNAGPIEETLPSYSELDVRVGWHATPNLDISIVGQNLLHDHHAEYGLPGPMLVEIQRSIYAKLVWHF
jgi:iron complex outermembrane receptor protein